MLSALMMAAVGFVTTPALAAPVESFLHPMGPVAKDQAVHFYRIIAITMIAIVPVIIGVPLILWRYRYRDGKGRYAPEWSYSGRLELAMWGVPVVIVAILAAWLWHATARFDPYRRLGPQPLQVQVVGLDWKWVFLYPEQGVATVNYLAIPVGRPVELTLTTDTVMQSIIIAPLVGQIYAMPGMTTRLNFIATRKGIAEGKNMQFNGDGFGRQKFIVQSMPSSQFDQWAAAARNSEPLTPSLYATLRHQTTLADARRELGHSPNDKPLVYRMNDPALFAQIVAKYRAPEGAARDVLGGIGAPIKGAKAGGS